MTDAAASYEFACAMMRLRALIRGERWPQPEDTFDLVAAASLARMIERHAAAKVRAE